MVSKYGADRVSEIITFDFLKARAAVKDTGRALGVPYALCDQITKHIDPRNTIAEAMAEKEDGAYLSMAEDIIPTIIEAQSADVDTISGATFSSTGIKNASEQALEKAVK